MVAGGEPLQEIKADASCVKNILRHNLGARFPSNWLQLTMKYQPALCVSHLVAKLASEIVLASVVFHELSKPRSAQQCGLL